MRLHIPFVGPDFANRSSDINGQRTLNLWPRTQKAGAKASVTLEGTPGLSLVAEAGTGPWRSNAVEFAGALYAVSADKLYQIDSVLTATLIGTLSTTGGRVEMVAGRDYLLIVDGTTGYTYDGTTFATIADVDFPVGASHCAILNGWFIVNEADSDQFWVCEVQEVPTGWSAIRFATAEAAPDDILALIATYKELYLFGQTTIQTFYDSGNPLFPFDPYPGGVIDIGIQAPHSLAKSPIGLFFLGTTAEGDASVVQLVGTQPRVISDDIAWELSQMATTDDAHGFIYRVNGRTIYQLTFPTEGKTFEYLAEEGFWVERTSYGLDGYEAGGHGWINGYHVMLDRYDGNYYRLDFDSYLDGALTIERIRIAPTVHADGRRIIFHELIVEFEAGVGTATGQGSDPQAMLSYSDDGGHTWSSELWTGIGKTGEYTKRARWAKLGQARSRQFKLAVTDPVKVVILNAYANVTLCSS